MRIITFSNNKGGSGKTTTTVSLAACFAERGLRVLVVDLDPQGSATDWLGGREATVGLIAFSGGGVRVSEIVMASNTPNVDLVPTSPSLVPPGELGGNETGFAIVRAFAKLPDYWDLVLVDTPPTLGHLSLAALAASNGVVIPVEAHALVLPGVSSVIASIDRARGHVNPRLELLGIVACRVTTSSHVRDVVTRLRSEFGSAVLDGTIREAIQIAEAPMARRPINQHAPRSPVADDYRVVATELLDRIGDLQRA